MATLYVCIAVLVAYCAGIFTPSVAKVLVSREKRQIRSRRKEIEVYKNKIHEKVCGKNRTITLKEQRHKTLDRVIAGELTYSLP